MPWVPVTLGIWLRVLRAMVQCGVALVQLWVTSSGGDVDCGVGIDFGCASSGGCPPDDVHLKYITNINPPSEI